MSAMGSVGTLTAQFVRQQRDQGHSILPRLLLGYCPRSCSFPVPLPISGCHCGGEYQDPPWLAKEGRVLYLGFILCR